MPCYVAFLRAVNVGGRFVKMTHLRAALSLSGFGDVETHVQSGNIRVTTRMRSLAKAETVIESTMLEAAGFAAPAMVRTPEQLRALATGLDGIPALLSPPGRRYVFFAKDRIAAKAAAEIDGWAEPQERAMVVGSQVLLELGTVVHLAKLGNVRLERMTGQPLTARDIKVIRALCEKLGA